ncbi:MAG: tetratricopeptide repeat protein [Cyanobacteria bacterium J06632_3]
MTAELTDKQAAGVDVSQASQLLMRQLAESTEVLSRGISLAQQHQFEQAIAHFNRVIHLSSLALTQGGQTTPQPPTPYSPSLPNHLSQIDRITAEDNTVKAYYHRACTLCRIDCYAQAITDFSYLIHQISIAGDRPHWAASKLAEIYIHRGNAYRRLGHFSQALGDLNEAVKRAKGSTQSHSCRGLLRLDMGDFAGAIADLDQALAHHPTFAQGYLWRGFAQLRSGQPASALSDLTRAIEAIPTCAEAYNHRGVAHFQLHQYTQALDDFDQAIRLKSDFAEAYNNRGNLWQLMGESGNAVADYDRAIALDPYLAELYFNRAAASNSHRAAEYAAADYDATAGLPLNDAAFYRHRAQVRVQQRHWHGAIADYTAAIAITPTAYAYHQRGKAYLKLGEIDQARADFDCAIATLPDYAEVYCDRAPLRFQLNEVTGALADIDQAIELAGGDISSQHYAQLCATRCLAHFCLGERDRAMQDFETLIDQLEAAQSSSFQASSFQSSSSQTSNDATSIGSSAGG